MTSILRSLAVLGGTLLLAATTLTGCGRATSTMAPMGYGHGNAAYQRMSAMDAPAGAFRPLPQPTATPAPGKPSAGGGGQPDDVDMFTSYMQHYGYHGDRESLSAAVEAVTHRYPTQWDPSVNVAQHYQYWQSTLGFDVAKDEQSYAQDAIRLAQYRFDVIYYVWVSKQDGGQDQNGTTPPYVNFDTNLPIVKGIKNSDGWIVQIGPQGTVLDFLEMPNQYLNDFNHLIPIPQELY
ncbi:MAG TPA: hypothetical protein V6D47_06350 [Oscillatoriaceae cyanobacterium]